jgi:UDP-glucuronate 4-epimerase
MAYFSFAEAILRGQPITVYDGGRLKRDFTYIDDVVAGVVGCLDRPPAAERGLPPVRLLNIGNNRPETVSTLIALLEQALGRPAELRFAPRPAADVEETCAAVEAIGALTGFAPRTPLAVGIPRFAAWLLGWRGAIMTRS